MYQRWKDTTDVLLVFTGLFSAVVTTFLVEASGAFQDPQQILASQMAELISIQRALANGSSITGIPPSSLQPGSETASALDRWINGLWLISLLLSLVAALITLLVKQWLHHYMSPISGTPLDQALIRQFRFDNLNNWGVDTIIEALPLLLHLSLLIFFCGLAIFGWQLDFGLSILVMVIGGITLLYYLTVGLLPIFCVDCPYVTPWAQSDFSANWQPFYFTVFPSFHGERTDPNIKSFRGRESAFVLRQDQRSRFSAKAMLWLHTESSANPNVRKLVEQVPIAMMDNILRDAHHIYEETWRLCKELYRDAYTFGDDFHLIRTSLYVLSHYFLPPQASYVPEGLFGLLSSMVVPSSAVPRATYLGQFMSRVPTLISLDFLDALLTPPSDAHIRMVYFQQCMNRFPITFLASGRAPSDFHLFALAQKCVFEMCQSESEMISRDLTFALHHEGILPMITWITWMVSGIYTDPTAHDNLTRYISNLLQKGHRSKCSIDIKTFRPEIFHTIRDQLLRDAVQGEVEGKAYERMVWIRSALQLHENPNNEVYVYRPIESGSREVDEEYDEYQGKPCYKKLEPFQSKTPRPYIPESCRIVEEDLVSEVSPNTPECSFFQRFHPWKISSVIRNYLVQEKRFKAMDTDDETESQTKEEV